MNINVFHSWEWGFSSQVSLQANSNLLSEQRRGRAVNMMSNLSVSDSIEEKFSPLFTYCFFDLK